jgi:hypothetical protein
MRILDGRIQGLSGGHADIRLTPVPSQFFFVIGFSARW